MGRISGQVIEDGTNTPVVDAHVIVLFDGNFAPVVTPTETVTDRNGRYHLDNLPAGRYRIAAQKAGFAPPMDPSTMRMFEVSAGKDLEGLIVWLGRGGTISGRVLDPLGQPLAEVRVMALLKRLESSDRPADLTDAGAPLLVPADQSQTNDLGEFRTVGLSPGDYVIVANPPSALDGATSSSATTIMTSTFFPGTADVSDAQAVTVKAGQMVSDLTIQLVTVPAFQVSGVVVDEAGAPVAGTMVMLMGGLRAADVLISLDIEPRGMTQSDATGRFTFGHVPAGSYTLVASDSAGGVFSTYEEFVIDGSGTPRVDPKRPKHPAEPGTIEVTIENASVGDLELVVPKTQ
jgi:Carboxypeptidase regulatory-like domain